MTKVLYALLSILWLATSIVWMYEFATNGLQFYHLCMSGVTLWLSMVYIILLNRVFILEKINRVFILDKLRKEN